MDGNVLIAIAAAVPATITAISTAIFNREATRRAERHSAKQSILQMILEDMFYWSVERRLPMNWQAIQDEYKVYSKNGGNGEMSVKVQRYNQWFVDIEKQIYQEHHNK